MENVLVSIDSYFSDEFTSQLANSLDETQAGIRKALSAIIPLTFQKLTAISENGAEGQNEITRITSDAAQYYAHMPNLSKLHNDERGSDLPVKIYGKDKNNLTTQVAVFAGIREMSADRLLTLALPVIAGKTGEYFRQNDISAGGITNFLSSNKENIATRIPADYNRRGNRSEENKDHANNGTLEITKKKKMFPTWVMFAVIILVFLLLIYFSRGCNSPKAVTSMSQQILQGFVV